MKFDCERGYGQGHITASRTTRHARGGRPHGPSSPRGFNGPRMSHSESIYFSCVEMLVKLVLSEVPKPFTVTIIITAMPVLHCWRIRSAHGGAFFMPGRRP